MKKFNLLLFTGILILLNCCSYPHFYYSPNIQHVPLFDDRNEFSGSIAGSVGIVNNCVELQAGYSLPGHVALSTNFMTGGNNHETGSYRDFSKLSYFEGSLGFYTSFSETGIFEIYGGYGLGSQRHSFTFSEFSTWYLWDREPDGTADMSFSKIFIQPNIGIRSEWVEAAFSCRFSRLNFKEINIYNTVYHLDELNTLKLNSAPTLLEPALTFRAGSESIKGQIQLGFAARLSNPDLELMFESLRFSLGIHFYLSGK